MPEGGGSGVDLLFRIAGWLGENEATISAVVGIAVLGGIVFAGVRSLLSRRSVAATETAPEEDPLLALPTGPVVAVLPFENLSRDPEQEFFSDGLTEGIITALSRFKDLFVIARNSTFRYKGEAVDVRQLNKELGARYVLEGSVQKAQDALRVTAQLLDAKDGTHLWAETYDRELSAENIFGVQDEITEQVVASIAGFYGVISRARFAEIQEKPTKNLDAYECVLQTHAYYRDNWNATEHAKVRAGLERAVKSDPGYVEAWACLCFIYLDEHRDAYNPRPDPLDRALDAARRAVASDPASQLAHLALAEAFFYRHELDGFFAEAERAIALNPNNVVTVASLGDKLAGAGDERGIALVRRAMKLDPFHPTWFYLPIAAHHFERGEYDRALAAARKINIPGFDVPLMYLAAIYAELGRQAEAGSAIEELLKLCPGFTTGTYIEWARKWNRTDESIRRWVAALRKAGLPEESAQ
jgi:adenylate cyclase